MIQLPRLGIGETDYLALLMKLMMGLLLFYDLSVSRVDVFIPGAFKPNLKDPPIVE